MKPILGIICGIGVVMLAVHVFNQHNVEEYVNPELPFVEEVQEEEVIEMDVLDKAKQGLESINAELDAEETMLIQEIEEREQRLEQIREIRMSF